MTDTGNTATDRENHAEIERIFPTSDSDQIYLLSHSVGRLPHGSTNHIESEFLSVWEKDPEQAWPVWLERIEEFRALLAHWFNGTPAAFCPQVNVSAGLSKILGSLPNSDNGDSAPGIAFTENDFPSIGFVFDRHQRRGLVPHMMEKHTDPQDMASWEQLLTPDVGVVLITHVHYNTNRLIPVADIVELAGRRGIISIVDVAQSAGIVPIDVKSWNADVVLGSCIKWLCGGPGAGFMWINPATLASLEPLDVGWFSHRDPFEFDINHFAYADDSLRFWGGTPSVMPAVMASHSLKQLASLGSQELQKHNRKLSQIFIDQLGPECIVSPLNLNAKGGTTVIKPRRQAEAIQALRDAGVAFDARELGIRMSPHIYNNSDEIERVSGIIKPFL